MARRKKKKTTRRRRTSKRPIVLQIPAPRRRKNPVRRRKRRRNPAAATVVNPRRRRRRRRRRRNPSLMSGIKSTFTAKTLVPIAIGGGLGVVGISLSSKYLTTRIDTKWQALIEAGVGLAGLPLVNRAYPGAGPYFTGFMVGSALARVLTPLLPWGEIDDDVDALVEGTGAIEFIGDGLDESENQKEDGDEAAAGDAGLEDVISANDGQEYLVDGLGILPPMPVPRMPRPFVGMLRRRGMLWLARLKLPQEEIQRLMDLPPLKRRGALMRLRALYRRKRAMARRANGARFAETPLVKAHPVRRPRVPGKQGKPGRQVITRSPGAKRVAPPQRPQRPVRRGGRRGRGKFGEVDEYGELDELPIEIAGGI